MYNARPDNESVTVAIPTRDPDGSFLGSAIESVLCQSRPVERLVVIDNSQKRPEEVRRLCESYGPGAVEYLPPIRDLAAYENHQRALAVCDSSFVSILQDDDLYAHGFVERAVAELRANEQASLFAVNYAVIDETSSVVRERGWNSFPAGTLSPAEFVTHAIELMSPVHLSASMFRRSAAISNAFYEIDANCFDIGFFLRLVAAGPVVLVDEPLASVREHSRSLSFGEGFYGREGSIAVSVAPVEWRTKERFMRSNGGATVLGSRLQEVRRRGRNRILHGYTEVLFGRGYAMRDRISCARSIMDLLIDASDRDGR